MGPANGRGVGSGSDEARGTGCGGLKRQIQRLEASSGTGARASRGGGGEDRGALHLRGSVFGALNLLELVRGELAELGAAVAHAERGGATALPHSASPLANQASRGIARRRLPRHRVAKLAELRLHRSLVHGTRPRGRPAPRAEPGALRHLAMRRGPGGNRVDFIFLCDERDHIRCQNAGDAFFVGSVSVARLHRARRHSYQRPRVAVHKKELRDSNPLLRRPLASPRPVPCRVLAQSVFMSLSSGVRPSPVVMVSLKVPPPGTMGRTCSWCGNMTSRR